MTNINDLSYCLGMSIAGSLRKQGFREIAPEAMLKAIQEAFEGTELQFSPEQADEIISSYLSEQQASAHGQNKELGEAFLEENKKRAEVQVTDSGLQYEVLQEGDGATPGNTDTVKVHYEGTLIDGTVFDSSYKRGNPASFGVHQVITGWTEALQLMPVGSKYRLYIPQELAYGAHPHPGGAIQPFSALLFDVELLEII
jgi:FKBP-type peptidyl-prolyl cis-trans isomerase FklB